MSQAIRDYDGYENVVAILHEMIEETIYHTQTFAHVFKIHQNHKVAEVFSEALKQFNSELEIVLQHIKNIKLPDIPPWEKPYEGYTHPSLILLDAHYLMPASDAVELIDAMVSTHRGFYVLLRDQSSEERVVKLATVLAETIKG